MAYFFFDYKDEQKQDLRALLVSLLVQLSNQSDSFCDILHGYHSMHQRGSLQPKESELIKCLKDMLKIPGGIPVYLIVDALDECSKTGVQSSREDVVELLLQLVGLKLPNLRLCFTSRPEIDIRMSLGPLVSTYTSILLHDERGQQHDIENYINFVVSSRKFNTTGWTDEDKKLVIDTLSRRAGCM
jgi:hypothetical protein